MNDYGQCGKRNKGDKIIALVGSPSPLKGKSGKPFEANLIPDKGIENTCFEFDDSAPKQSSGMPKKSAWPTMQKNDTGTKPSDVSVPKEQCLSSAWSRKPPMSGWDNKRLGEPLLVHRSNKIYL